VNYTSAEQVCPRFWSLSQKHKFSTITLCGPLCLLCESLCNNHLRISQFRWLSETQSKLMSYTETFETVSFCPQPITAMHRFRYYYNIFQQPGICHRILSYHFAETIVLNVPGMLLPLITTSTH